MVEVIQQVIKLFVDDVLAPAIARTGDLDGVVQNVKVSVATYMEQVGSQKDILAKHFGKSERSVYRYFGQMDRYAASRKVEASHEGVQLMNRILEYYYDRKDALPASACVSYVRRQNPSLSPSDIQGLLDLYATMGLLRRITEEEGGNKVVRYQAPDQSLFQQGGTSHPERMDLLRRKLRALLPVILAYARQEEGASVVLLRGRLLRHHLVDAMRDINEFAKQRWIQAREASEQEDPEGRGDAVDACSLLLGGPGGLDDLEVEQKQGTTAARGSRAAS